MHDANASTRTSLGEAIDHPLAKLGIVHALDKFALRACQLLNAWQDMHLTSQPINFGMELRQQCMRSWNSSWRRTVSVFGGCGFV